MYKSIRLSSVIHSPFYYQEGCRNWLCPFCVSQLLHIGEWKKLDVSFFSVSAPIGHVLKAKIAVYLHKEI